MKRSKNTLRALMLGIMVAVSLIAPVNVASAASVYDSVIETADSVHLSRDSAIQSSPGCAPLDITSSWETILTNSSSWTSRTQIIGGATKDATLVDWTETQGIEGGYAVVQQHNNNSSYPDSGNSIGDAVYVVFTPSASAQVTFSSNAIYWGAQKQAYMTNSDDAYVYSVRIQFDDLGSSGGSDQCTPVISMALREPSSTPSYWENESVAATSTESTGGYSLKPLSVKATVNYPPSYEGLLAPSVQPPAKYVALGDSFSSGEGSPPFEVGTNEDGVNECHRSPQAYPRLLQNSQNLRPIAFVACAGAKTDNVLYGGSSNGSWGKPSQVNALSGDTEIATITIGGNDVGFDTFAYECLFPVDLTHGTCDEFTDIYKDTARKINNELPGKLETVYSTLLDQAVNADIYVLGYPNVAPYKDIGDPFEQNCGGLYDEFPNNWGDARAAHEITSLLNGAIENAVNTVSTQRSSSRLKFVPVDNGAFAGHDACSSDPYFNGIVFPDSEYSVHPNAKGHIAYKEDLSSAMS